MGRMPETIPEALARNVVDFPDREAFVSVLHRTGAWVRHTWREMDEISDRLAAGLAAIGVREIGETVLRGPNVMKGYYKNPESTAEALRNGWLHTGDMGYYDEDGYFYYSDRKQDMVSRGGFNIYPVEVESVLYEHSAIKQCAVIGKPHPKLGEDVLALVVLNEGASATAEEMIEFCVDKLAGFKRPREIQFVEELPINPMGKLDKKLIRATHLATEKESN